MAKPIIELKDVVKTYDDKVILNHINLSINKGEFVTLLGPSRKWQDHDLAFNWRL